MATEVKFLQDFLSCLSDYSPVFPDEMVDYYTSTAGMPCSELAVRRLLAVATQKFVTEVAKDALQHSRMRQGKQKGGKVSLTNEDLAVALKEYGVNLKRPEYFADSIVTGVAIPASAPSAAVPAAPAAKED